MLFCNWVVTKVDLGSAVKKVARHGFAKVEFPL
jgi:hypothetical protein